MGDADARGRRGLRRGARSARVDANRVVAVAFGLSGLLAGAAALLLVGQTGTIFPTMGLTPVLFGFTAAVIGGMGSLPGAVLGGYLLGAISTAAHDHAAGRTSRRSATRCCS